tara:strand:- start:182 stop:397 length:216 start_codon:yes stop_codon:yes gene_type:complete
MFSQKKIKEFDNLDDFPDLKNSLISFDKTLPLGSRNTKVIINKGEIVEKIYQTPNGEIISLLLNQITAEAA